VLYAEVYFPRPSRAERSDLDLVGDEFDDRHAAWKEATITAGQMLQSLDETAARAGLADGSD
jgi:hypothetical protein